MENKVADLYYREKVISLIDKIFIETGDARSRIINCENKIFNVYSASSSSKIPKEIQDKWKEIWSELNKERDFLDKKGRIIASSLSQTLRKKRNKSMEKYLLFFLEEFYRVL